MVTGSGGTDSPVMDQQPKSRVHVNALRRLVFFLLGVAVIIEEVWAPGAHPLMVIAGLILLGLIPVDCIIERFCGSDEI